MMVNGKMVTDTVKESKLSQTVPNMRENGLTIKRMEKVL